MKAFIVRVLLIFIGAILLIQLWIFFEFGLVADT